MNIRIRAKAGQPVRVFDENGKEIEGLLGVALEPCAAGEVPVVLLRVRAPVVEMDVEARVTTVQSKPAPRGDASVQVTSDMLKIPENPSTAVGPTK